MDTFCNSENEPPKIVLATLVTFATPTTKIQQTTLTLNTPHT
jgi:hypothetical protein